MTNIRYVPMVAMVMVPMVMVMVPMVARGREQIWKGGDRISRSGRGGRWGLARINTVGSE